MANFVYSVNIIYKCFLSVPMIRQSEKIYNQYLVLDYEYKSNYTQYIVVRDEWKS